MQSNRSEESFHGHHDGEGPQRRLLLIVLLLIAAAVVLALCLRGAGGETEKPRKQARRAQRTRRASPSSRATGWQVEPEPVKTQQVTVPADPSEVFLRYNELQISQGYDLLQYSGKELTRYVYRTQTTRTKAACITQRFWSRTARSSAQTSPPAQKPA